MKNSAVTSMTYFGYSDSNDEVDISKYFYQSPLYDQLKKGDKKVGKFVVHGIKGAGKSAMCNMIKEENASGLVCKIDKTLGFDVTKLGKHASPIESLLITLLLNELVHEILLRKSEFEKDSVTKVGSLSSKVKETFLNLLKGTRVKAGPIEFDLDKIVATDITRFSRFKISEYVSAIAPVLREKKGYILIDDVDDVFVGADENPAFIEGLVRAVKEINFAFGSSLHCLVFLKSGLFKLFFGNAKEYDKLYNFVASMSWGKPELVHLLALRIQKIHGVDKPLAAFETWKLDFEAKSRADLEDLQDYIVSRCVSGPRDLIFYCIWPKKPHRRTRYPDKLSKMQKTHSQGKNWPR